MVDHLRQCARDPHLDADLLEKFARHAVINGFPGVEFSTGYLPESPIYGVGGAAGDQDLVGGERIGGDGLICLCFIRILSEYDPEPDVDERPAFWGGLCHRVSILPTVVYEIFRKGPPGALTALVGCVRYMGMGGDAHLTLGGGVWAQNQFTSRVQRVARRRSRIGALDRRIFLCAAWFVPARTKIGEMFWNLHCSCANMPRIGRIVVLSVRIGGVMRSDRRVVGALGAVRSVRAGSFLVAKCADRHAA